MQFMRPTFMRMYRSLREQTSSHTRHLIFVFLAKISLSEAKALHSSSQSLFLGMDDVSEQRKQQ